MKREEKECRFRALRCVMRLFVCYAMLRCSRTPSIFASRGGREVRHYLTTVDLVGEFEGK